MASGSASTLAERFSIFAEPLVEHSALGLGDRYLARGGLVAGDAVPQLFDQLEPGRDIEREQLLLRRYRHVPAYLASAPGSSSGA